MSIKSYTTLGRKVALACLFSSLSMSAFSQSGTVYRDANANGVKDSREIGVKGVLVRSFINSSGTAHGYATTGDNGMYTLSPAPPTGASVRVEFSFPTTFGTGVNAVTALDRPSAHGTGDANPMRFVTGAASNVNFAVMNYGSFPNNINDDNPISGGRPFILAAKNNIGAPDGIQANKTAVMMYDYDATGKAGNIESGTAGPGTQFTQVATYAEVGSVFGMAFSPHSRYVFVSALVRRLGAMGPGGSGAIYVYDVYNQTLVHTINMDAMGFATRASGAYTPVADWPWGVPSFICGQKVVDESTFPKVPTHLQVGTNAERGLPTFTSVGNPPLDIQSIDHNVDLAAYSQVGKVGLGDIDLSEDGRYLYVTNLYDRKIYRIDLQNASNPVWPTAAQVSSFDITGAGITASNGVARPFGLKVKNGLVYVGVVSTNENVYRGHSGIIDPADKPLLAGELMGHVVTLNPLTSAWNNVVSFDFNKRSRNNSIVEGPGAAYDNAWFNWYETPYDIREFEGLMQRPQPIISDIELDDNGDVIIGIADRFAWQGGYNMYQMVHKTTSLEYNNVFYAPCSSPSYRYTYTKHTAVGLFNYGGTGDILKAFYNPVSGNYTMENGTQSGCGGSGSSLTTPPGFAEFYCGDGAGLISNPTGSEGERTQGSLAIRPGFNEVVVTGRSYDGNTAGWFANGTRKLNNSTGAFISEFLTQQAPYSHRTGGGVYLRGSTEMGKGNSFGDIEIGNSRPPLILGNRVWEDANGNGIQDPNEAGIAGVELSVAYYFNSTWYSGLLTTTTDANGNYIIKTPVSYGDEIFPPGFEMYIYVSDSRFNTSGGHLNIGGTGYSPTIVGATDANDPSKSYMRDNNGTMTPISGNPPFAGRPYTLVTLPDPSNYEFSDLTLDFGFTNVGPVSLDLLSFDAIKAGAGDGIYADLNWDVENAKNVSHFEVMASTDAKTFKTIGTVKFNENVSTYNFQDRDFANYPSDRVFYKLAIVDFDKKTDFSGIKMLSKDNLERVFTVHPTVSSNYVTLTMQNYTKETVQIQLVDNLGRIIHNQSHAIKSQQDQVKLNLSQYSSGIYFIKLIDANGTFSVKRVVKD